MARLTPMTLPEAQQLGGIFGMQVVSVTPIVHGSVNSNFSAKLADGGQIFLRVCEECDAADVQQQNRLLLHLVERGVPTPAPLPRADGQGSVANHRDKPVAAFPFIEGGWCCQKQLDAPRLMRVGEALGRIHEAGRSFVDPPAGRFGSAQLSARLDALATQSLSAEIEADAALLRARLEELAQRPPCPAPAVIHGDVFRDNVLWRDDRTLAAVLDFESASLGSPAFDLMVTLLAWCFGDTLEQPLARALLDGYRAAAPLDEAMLSQCYDEARAAAVRFAITRITDYELRPQGTVVYKDYRRFMRRLAAIEAIGAGGFVSWLSS